MRKVNSFALFLIVLGIIILLDTTNAFEGAFLKLWPMLLISLGISKILNSLIEEKH